MTRPIPTPAAVMQFDSSELTDGRRDYAPGDPEPGANRSDAYWWGWWVGRDPEPDDPDPRAVQIYWAMREVAKHITETAA